ncbi:MAG: GNAT family N-acetyltransferase [Methanocorpusculaceae archaeon]|nr:GNAT family N-acetyltransferase [Methanocorpusculaceae archaeon]
MTVKILESDDLETASRTFASAYFNYPFPSLSIAEPRRMECLEILFRSEMEYLIKHGTVEANSADCGGIAVWSTVGAAGSGAPATSLIRRLFGKMKISEMIHLARNSYAVGKGRRSLNLPDDTLYLYAIGVLPEMQGKGIASKLILDKLAECSNKTVYLETNTEHNCRFYQKFGFEPVLKTFYKKNNLTTWYMVKYPKT